MEELAGDTIKVKVAFYQKVLKYFYILNATLVLKVNKSYIFAFV